MNGKASARSTSPSAPDLRRASLAGDWLWTVTQGFDRPRYLPDFSDRSRSLRTLRTMPALPRAMTLTLYSADVPNTCDTSESVRACRAISQSAMLVVALLKAWSSDASRPIVIKWVEDSMRGPAIGY